MNCLRRPGDSDYDVLGVSPQASDEEIGKAFHRLIEQQGFKSGVPLDRQWARAREIKAAYATLSDPVKRQAYDETHAQTSSQSAFASDSKDTATNALVMPRGERLATEPGEMASLDAVDPGDARGAAQAGFRSLPVPAKELEPDLDETEWFVHDRRPPPYLAQLHIAPPQSDFDRAPTLRRGVVPAIAIASGLVLMTSWLWWDGQSSTNEGSPKVAGRADRASAKLPSLDPSSAQVPLDLTLPPTVRPKGQGAATVGSYALRAANQHTSPQRAGGSATAQASELASRGTQDKVASATGPAAIAPSTPNAPPSPTADGAQTAASKPLASRPSAIASPRQQAMTVPAINGASGAVVNSVGRVQRPAQWLGGGPTDADNRGGRYHGAVAVKVTVGPAGRVSNCIPYGRSGSDELDTMTCRLVLDRARFTPAIDAQGRPVASEAFTTVVWSRRRRN